MAVVALEATVRGLDLVHGKGEGGTVKSITRTVETNSDDSATSTIDFGEIPSNARILGASTLYWDDLASTGAPTLDVGLFGSQITDDDDALNDGLDLATASTGSALVKDAANYGKYAWEHVSGQTTDPKGSLTVKGTIKDAAINTAGTVTLELFYTLD